MQLSIIEFLLRSIPEGLLFTYAAYVFTKKDIRLKPFLLSSILLAIETYGVQFLPIHKGINNILNIIVFILLVTKVNKIDLMKSIKVIFGSMLLMFLCEGINVVLIQAVFKLDINYIFSIPKLKVMYGIPSLLLFVIIISTVHYRTTRKKNIETNLSN
jgi:hypothetical protein